MTELIIFAAAVIMILLAAYLFMIFPCIKKPNNSKIFTSSLYAHRGLHNKNEGIPENTMAAFKRAVDQGYGIELDVHLTKDGKTKGMFVHRIVAEAFIPNENNLPMVNHKDEDKTNNFVENLEWCTASYNRTYGNAVEKQAKKLRGKKHTEEHKAKISMSMKMHFCSYGERRDT